MKKRLIFTICIIFAVCLVACAFIPQLLPHLNAADVPTDEETARQNLIETVQSIETENGDTDYLTEDGSCLVFRNINTLNFLSEAFVTAEFEETTGYVCSTWPLPMYYVGEQEIGGYFTFISTVNDRSFHFYLSGKNETFFRMYVTAIEQLGELSGIECTDTPSYLEFT